MPLLALLAALSLASPAAFAWTEASPSTAPCHERLADASLEMAGLIAPPPPLTGKDRQLFDYVQFDASPYGRDIYVLSLLIGSRWNDTRGGSTFEIWKFLEEMSDPEDSGEHCLRKPGDDGEAGDARALLRCREAVRTFARLAWSFAAAEGEPPDPDLRVEVPEFLLYTGTTDVSLSGFYFYAGRALHTVQDSFVHAYRSEDRMTIVEIVNGVEELTGRGFDPATDGPAHRQAMDDCECERPMLDETLEASGMAGTELLRVLASDPATREEDLEVFLERWFALEAGCTIENGYCGSPDAEALREATCGGCTMVEGSGGGRAAIVLACLLVGVVCFLRKKGAGALLAAALALAPLPALAGEARETGKADECTCAKALPGEKSGPFVALRVGGSLWRPALAVQGSAGWAWRKWSLGYVMEWNPWIALESSDAAPGAYATGIELSFMIPMTPKVKLRFGTVQGLGVLLFGPYGHHQGEIGPWSAFRILGLDIRVSRRVTVMFDPVDMVILVINPARLPLLYQQWRWSLAVRFK